MSIVFLLLISFQVLLSYLYTKSIYNVYIILAVPYLFIVLINHFVASPCFGFFEISDETLTMLLFALTAFFVGALPLSKPNLFQNQLTVEEKFSNYHMRWMVLFELACGVICLIWSLYVMITGLESFRLSTELFEEAGIELSSGPIAHLKLVGMSIAPITFAYGINKKEPIAIVGTLCLLVAVFMTFTKYNIICAVIAIILFLGINKQITSRKLLIPFIGIPILLFVVNYYIGFAIRGVSSKVSDSFYLNHLWTYIAGSVIYDNYIFTIGIRIGYSTIEKLLTFFFAFPNLFLGKLFGIKVFPHIQQPFLLTSIGGEKSNVTDAIGYLYPSYGNLSEQVLFYIVMILIGLLFTLVMRIMSRTNNTMFSTALPFFLSEFVFMSFFGTFYVSPGPWEQLLLCIIVPQLFLVR